MGTIWHDVRFAFRSFLKNPGFTAVAVLSLALGVGANTTIFTLLNAVLLSPLPVARPSELVAVFTTDQMTVGNLGNLLPVSYPNFKDFRERNTTLADMAAYTFGQQVSATTGAEPQQAFAEVVTGNYFDLLGVTPQAGRFFRPDEDVTPMARPVVVLSYGFWQRRLGGDPGIIGRSLPLNGLPFTVIGVTRNGFRGVNSLFSPDMWVPMMMASHVLGPQNRTWPEERRALLCFVGARLKPGTTLQQAEANIQAIAKSLEEEYPAPNNGRNAALRPLAQATIFPGIRDVFVRGGAVLMTIVGLVLLIACSNIANLLMARGAARRQEMAVRVSLGASRGRLVRQLLVEAVLMAIIAGAIGLLIASAGRDAIWSLRPAFLAQNFVDLTLDARVLTFTALLSLATVVVFGLIPALRASRADVVTALKEESRSAGPSRQRLALSNILVVLQVALSVVALVAAGLFLRSLQQANRIDPGFDVDHTAVVGVNPGQGGYDEARAAQFFRNVSERLSGTGGIDAHAWASGIPLTGGGFRTVIREGADPESTDGRTLASYFIVSPAYLQTVRIPLLRGRDFTDADRAGTEPVAIVNQTFADRMWPNQDPVGRRFRFYVDQIFRRVIGVTKTVKYGTLAEDPQNAVYVPLEQNPSDTMVLFLRTQGSPGTVLGPAQAVIRALDPHVPLTNPTTMRDILSQSLWPARLAAILLGVLGGLALVLASVGLYGLMAYSVAQRTQEIGLRMALGADGGDVLKMVLRQSMGLAVTGLLLGLAGALAVSRLVARLLYGMSPMDPTTFVGVAALLLGIAFVASAVPALRASRLDPLRALR